jgi:curved DNA-binding protein CbpA
MRPLLPIILFAVLFGNPGSASVQQCDDEPPSGDPYAILGVEKNAGKNKIIKSYRLLAKRWHPDKNKGTEDAKAVFATIAQAYEVLIDPEKREILDRLGEDGLERLRDGDPSVKKDYLPPDEILRRLHKDGAEPWHQSLVTSSFAYFASFDFHRTFRWLPILLGIITESPYVIITATEDASGANLLSGANSSGDVTFKFSLSGKSTSFKADDVTHNCAKSKFLGMKATYYLQCAHSPGARLAVRVGENTFKTLGRKEFNSASETFSLAMV